MALGILIGLVAAILINIDKIERLSLVEWLSEMVFCGSIGGIIGYLFA